jgi:penicillin-binding protein 2
MARIEANPAARPGHLVEAHSTFQPRIIFFYFAIGAMLLVLAVDLGYQQVFKTNAYYEVERTQNQRRIILPGPRGAIVDREGRVLAGNHSRWAVVLDLGQLRSEFRREYVQIVKNFRDAGTLETPAAKSRKKSRAPASKEDISERQMARIARATVVQRYLDQVNAILGSQLQVESDSLEKQFREERLLPFMLVDDLSSGECARLIERLPVRSPLQVYASSTRYYPNDSAAAHTIGYVSINPDVDVQNFPGEGLHTFKMKGSIGRDGLEKQFDAQLQGKAGGAIFRVDPDGYIIDKPIDRLAPAEGGKVVTSLDLDLQLAAEESLGDQTGAVVALEVNTGEVLVLASKPDYNLNDFTSRINQATVDDIEKRKAWVNLAMNGFYPPGSTFKILTTIAALRSGAITPDRAIVDCEGTMRVGNRTFFCENGHGQHGEVLLAEAIAKSCDIYFYTAGALTTPQVVAAEARRFHLDRRTGIELPGEAGRMIIPDPAWKERERGANWYPGDTANMAIGQGDVLVSPLQMACFAASVARGEVSTQPTLLHHDNAARQQTEPIGLTFEQRAALLEGMEACTTEGTARVLALPELKIPGLRIAGKTGTAQVPGRKNVAWFICFAPIEQPLIAIAVAVEGDVAGEDFGGGRHAAPIANSVLKKWWEKKQRGNALVAPRVLPPHQ